MPPRAGRSPSSTSTPRASKRPPRPSRGEFFVPVVGLKVDVTDEGSVAASVEAVAATGLPPVGALANIAGVASPVPFLEVQLAEWHRVLDINLTGTFLMCRAYLPQMIEHGYGRIVNMSSVSAQQGGGVFSKTPYSAAKAGIIGLTRSLAREMAPHQITVNAVEPRRRGHRHPFWRNGS